MKKNSLVSKLLVTVTLIVALSFTIIAAVLSFWFKGYYFDQRKDLLDKQAQRISSAVTDYYANNKTDSVNNLNYAITNVSDTLSIDIILVDSLGYIYKVSNDNYINMKYQQMYLSSEEIDQLKQGNSMEDRTNSNKFLDVSDYIYYKPIISNNYYYGFIAMVTPLEKIKAPLNRFYFIIWLSAIIAVTVSAIIINMLAQKILIDPLNEINRAAKRLAKGEVGQRVDIRSKDEMQELAESFNFMAESLEKVDNNRREFISNVSHELRSPITSIKGFIAGILDGVIPKDKENYYLRIVYDEIQRLTRLVNELLDLSAMEAGKMELKIREIEINDIIKTVVMNLESKVLEKKVKVEVVFEGKRDFVLGDLDRIIQVITNIVDNAIKYANEGGNIKITTRSKGNKIYISVANEGIILKDSEINNIWNRFYKADKSRTNKMSTGLGLSIVREIITQHGQDIWVENEKDNSGVVFTFTLSKSN